MKKNDFRVAGDDWIASAWCVQRSKFTMWWRIRIREIVTVRTGNRVMAIDSDIAAGWHVYCFNNDIDHDVVHVQ